MPWIERIRLRNYRCFDDCELHLGKKTIIVGANNVGKTSLLEAIEGVLGVGRRGYGFDEDDLRRGSAPEAKIIIDLTISPDDSERFSADQRTVFGTHIDLYDGDRERLLIRIEAGLDGNEGIFRARTRFLKSDGEDDGPLGIEHRKALSVVVFSAQRDVRRELTDRSGIWSRITATSRLPPEQLEDLRRRGEQAGDAIFQDLLGPAIRTEVLSVPIADLMGTVLYGGAGTTELSFSAIPTDIRQLLRQIEVRLRTPSDASARPLAEHSTGTQAILLLGLFIAYTEALRLPVLAIGVEEPEVHLFPHAARSLAKRLAAIPAQTLLTTHSTAITDLADPRDIVVLRRKGDLTLACSVPEGHLSDDDAKDIARRMRSAGSAFVFARSILLMEGASEALAFPILAEHLGMDFDSLAISLVTADGNSFGAFAKLLHPDALNIPFMIICDNDAAVQSLVRGLAKADMLPAGVDQSDPYASRDILDAAGYCWWSDGDFESCLIAGGAGPVFRQAIAELYGPRRLEGFERQFQNNKGRPPADERELIVSFERAKGVSKPRIAQRVAELIREQNHAVPAEVERLLQRLASLARIERENAAGGDPSAQP